ncbi:protein Abitram-like isoform X1 [Lycorma delicatula]|uniref:protein Abitram-like isoform X1 n=1 Tax=Lycorma delicatula TaxID=130591 RepID=UPI003F512000
MSRDDCVIDVNDVVVNRVIPLEDSYDKEEKYQSVIERYFTPRYSLDVGMPNGDYCILLHSNRICIITIAPSHPLRSQNKNITKLDFQISTNIDRLNNHVSGKLKRGAQVLQQSSSPLFFVECSDGTIYKLCACIPGKLVEINDAIIKDPNLLIKDSCNTGFIAIILPSIRNFEQYRNELLTPEQYKTETGLESIFSWEERKED